MKGTLPISNGSIAESRIADWNGGYPRPFIEAIDKSWKALDDVGIPLPNDPDLEELAAKMKEARQKKLSEIEAKKRELSRTQLIRKAEREQLKREQEAEEERERIMMQAENLEQMRLMERERREKEIKEAAAQKKAEKEVKKTGF